MSKEPKEKKCEWCPNTFMQYNSLHKACCYDCSVAIINDKKKKREAKAWALEKKILKEKLKTLGQYEAEARKVFQNWIRLRDKDRPCISCGLIKEKRYDGGHWWKAELYSGLVFNEDNCHKQCSRPCNKDLGGDPANYRIGLVRRIGIKRVVWLEENKDRLRQYKYTREQLVEIKEDYALRIKNKEY